LFKGEEPLFRYILLAFISFNAFALEISIESAKDNFEKYAILQIFDKETFVCQEIKNDFEDVVEIVCAFKKQPKQPITHLENDFFTIDSFLKKETFFVSIKPVKKMKLYAEIFDLTKDDTVFSAKVTFSKRWSVIGYAKKLPIIKEEETPDIAINFPFYLDRDKLPYVGSLDLKGKPVHLKKVEDVKDYLKVKKYFSKKLYSECLDLIDETLQRYPNTLFKSELLYYKIKAYAKLKDYDSVISYAKEYLREYSSDENIPEIISLIAYAYAKIGLFSDADYFFDRLFSEHPNNLYAQWGYIYKGEMLESSGATSKAIEYYKKALYETKNLQVAASAAYHLANILLSTKPKEAAKYTMKIIKADAAYFMKNIQKSMEMMYAFADAGEYKTAAAIADAMAKSMGPTYDEYEELLKDKALWLAKTKDKKAAIVAINDYIKKFPDGDFISEIEALKDELFFDRDDLNATQKLHEYDKLIEEYMPDSIAKKALYEKAKLLLKLKEYEKVLAMKEQLLALQSDIYSDVENIIKEAAKGMMQTSLQKKNCKDVLTIANDYNISLSDSWDDGIYECAMKGGDYKLSKMIASKNLHSKNLQERKKWLFRYVKIDYETGNYTELISAAQDLIQLIDKPKKSPYKEVYRYLFDAYERLGQKEKMIETMAKIEEIFGLDYRDIDRYGAMVSLGSELHDTNMIITYGMKIMKIQEKSGAHPQSPFVEFALYDAYMSKQEYRRALKVIQSLDKVDLTKEQRARQKYLLGMVLSKLWRDAEAKKAYEAAIEADANSAWAKLAKSALEL
jgi:tetratricopeptide (TPR) repeat protein